MRCARAALVALVMAGSCASEKPAGQLDPPITVAPFDEDPLWGSITNPEVVALGVFVQSLSADVDIERVLCRGTAHSDRDSAIASLRSGGVVVKMAIDSVAAVGTRHTLVVNVDGLEVPATAQLSPSPSGPRGLCVAAFEVGMDVPGLRGDLVDALTVEKLSS